MTRVSRPGSRKPAARGRRAAAGREDARRLHDSGFTMVMFVVVLAIMAIMMGAAVQAVTFQMQREREEELIFRGGQYVEAIRLYKKRFGRNPISLKEMWDAKPRVIRKPFKDPILDTDAWGLVFLGEEGQQIGPGGIGGGPAAITPTPSPPPSATPGPGGSASPRVGPIVGVHSTSCRQSIKVLDGRTRYCDWKFVLKEAQQAGAGGRPGPGGPPGPGVIPAGTPRPPVRPPGGPRITPTPG